MTHLICETCPNGCRLEITRRDQDTLLVDGQHCPQGIGFARRRLRDTPEERFLPARDAHLYEPRLLAGVLAGWRKELAAGRPALCIPGSPERCAFRTVVDTADGQRFILEKLAPGTAARKRRIARRLVVLAAAGLPVAGPLKTCDGAPLLHHAGDHWQLTPFVEGVPLDRESYWRDDWRGRATADFLIRLAAAAGPQPGAAVFAIVDYIENLLAAIDHRRPELSRQVRPVADRLRQELFPQIDRLPTGFCHGDPHPLNTIWGHDDIRAVIDWEFCGPKPRIYDAALVIGAVGSEDAGALDGDFIARFVETLCAAGYFTPGEQNLLPLFVVAVRFAWLSEWLRRDDTAMVDFEVFYLDHLCGMC